MMHRDKVLYEVAAAARLEEGAEGVRRMLLAVFRGGPIPIRDLAQEVGLPVPVVAAVRGELEKRGVLVRQGGVALSGAGRAAVQQMLGVFCNRRFPRPIYPELPDDLSPVLDEMRRICGRRPEVDVRLDQSHATPETALRRAVYLYTHDALEGRDVLILGDDDLTSLALGIFADAMGTRPRSIIVLETDERLVQFLGDEAREKELHMEVIQCDLREALPDGLAGRFDAFLTDPPYTLQGLDLFVSRGVGALRQEVGKQGYICFGRRSPEEAASVFQAITEMGLAPVEVLPDFNRYVGAQLLAGVSQIIRTVSTPRLSPRVEGDYHGPLYTADRRRPRGAHAR